MPPVKRLGRDVSYGLKKITARLILDDWYDYDNVKRHCQQESEKIQGNLAYLSSYDKRS